jgi:cell division protein FtsA
MYLSPLALANAILTEAEKRSGCAMVDLGADTTTVAVFSKNVLRHLAVIPLGSDNITKDIASLQMEESDAEKMKLKYASAYTDNSDIDDTLKYSIDQDRQVESRKFIDIVEGPLEEIILNVREQIPTEYYGKLLGGIILTGGGSNMKNIEKAFAMHTRIEKIRIAKAVTMSINSSHDAIKNPNGMMNTALGLLAKGYINCAGSEIDPTRSLFEDQNENSVQQPDRTPRQAHEAGPGVIRTEQEEKLAEEEARRKREAEQAEERRKAEEQRLKEEAEREEEERKRRENSVWNKLKKAITKLGSDMVSPE